MFLNDIENFGSITRSIFPCSSIPSNLVQGGVCWDLSQIPLPVLEINKVISFCEIISWHPRSCCVFEIFCIMKIILFSYFGLKIFFLFGKMRFGDQDTVVARVSSS